jgi:hypothetical protein
MRVLPEDVVKFTETCRGIMVKMCLKYVMCIWLVYVKRYLALSGVRFSIEFNVAMGKIIPYQENVRKIHRKY